MEENLFAMQIIEKLGGLNSILAEHLSRLTETKPFWVQYQSTILTIFSFLSGYVLSYISMKVAEKKKEQKSKALKNQKQLGQISSALESFENTKLTLNRFKILHILPYLQNIQQLLLYKLYIKPNFNPLEKHNIEGNAVILQNKLDGNHEIYFIGNGQIIKNNYIERIFLTDLNIDDLKFSTETGLVEKNKTNEAKINKIVVEALSQSDFLLPSIPESALDLELIATVQNQLIFNHIPKQMLDPTHYFRALAFMNTKRPEYLKNLHKISEVTASINYYVEQYNQFLHQRRTEYLYGSGDMSKDQKVVLDFVRMHTLFFNALFEQLRLALKYFELSSNQLLDYAKLFLPEGKDLDSRLNIAIKEPTVNPIAVSEKKIILEQTNLITEGNLSSMVVLES